MAQEVEDDYVQVHLHWNQIHVTDLVPHGILATRQKHAYLLSADGPRWHYSQSNPDFKFIAIK